MYYLAAFSRMAGFHSFDGSKFSPIEEAVLILNTPSEDLFITTVRRESDKVCATEFQSFDGSKLSPIEEALLILNSPIEDLFISTEEESEKVSGTEFQSFDGSIFSPIKEAFLLPSTPIDELFTYPASAGAISENVPAEMCHIRDWNVDQAQQLQLSPSKCFDPWSHETDMTTYECDLISFGEVHSFDGSKFSPIEEAFLILNDPPANDHVFVAEKRGEASKDKGLDKTLKLQRELLEIKAQIKELGCVLESSLKRTDILLPKLPIQNALVAF